MKRGAVVAAGFIISILLLVVTALKISWQEAAAAFSHAIWLPWLPLAVGAYLIGLLLRGLRLKLLVSLEAKVTVWTASNIICVGYAANNILPARLGEFVRAGMLAERTGLPYALTLTVTFLERLLDGLTILCIFVVASLITPTQEWMRQAAELAGILFAIAIAFIWLLAFAPQFSLMLVSRISATLGRKVHDRAIALITQVTRGLSCLHDASTFLTVLSTSFAVWIVEGLMFALVMPCFGIPFSPVKAQAVMSLTNLGILVPSAPGFVGVYHVICARALQAVTGQFGLPAVFAFGFAMPNLAFLNPQFLQSASAAVSDATALSYAVVVHMVFYVTVTVWGVVAMARYGLELGTTAALAWQAKPMPASAIAGGVAVITSVAAKSEKHQPGFAKTRFWAALTEAIVPAAVAPLTSEAHQRCLEFSTDFVCHEMSNLPQSLRPLLKLGVIGFRTWAACTNLSPFESLPAERRRRIVDSWCYSPISLPRKFFKPIRSVALLAYYECPEVQQALDQSSQGRPAESARIEPAANEEKQEGKADKSKSENMKSEENKSEKSKLEENKLKESRTEENKLKESRTEESRTKKSKLEESKIKESRTEESRIKESRTEESNSRTGKSRASMPEKNTAVKNDIVKNKSKSSKSKDTSQQAKVGQAND